MRDALENSVTGKWKLTSLLLDLVDLVVELVGDLATGL